MSKQILIVDDDVLIRHSLSFNLEQAGYLPITAADAEEALALVEQEPPDLILLDIGLPGMDGLAALQQFRAHLSRVPIIFVTARHRELDEVLGLELGADDYITKPFDLNVLLARIKVVLRRFEQSSSESGRTPTRITVGDLMIDPTAHIVTVRGQQLELSPLEFDLLYTLAAEAGRVISQDELLTQVWGTGYEGESQIVYVHIRWLREKIEEDPRHPRRLITVRGIGYKLVPQPLPRKAGQGG
jgi:DNA-binding response OmpR family regulator